MKGWFFLLVAIIYAVLHTLAMFFPGRVVQNTYTAMCSIISIMCIGFWSVLVRLEERDK